MKLVPSIALLTIVAVGCGAPRGVCAVVEEGVPLHGPFASWEEICGAVRPGDASFSRTDGIERRERCDVQETALGDGRGPVLAMATYWSGNILQGTGHFGLRTSGGWFVAEIPERPPHGELWSHHRGASVTYSLAPNRSELGVLRIIARSNSFSAVPGQGALGATSVDTTSIIECRVGDGIVFCDAPAEIYRRDCHVTGELPDHTQEVCEERGTDIPPDGGPASDR